VDTGPELATTASRVDRMADPSRAAHRSQVLALLSALSILGALHQATKTHDARALQQRGVTTSATVLRSSYDPDGGDPNGWTTDTVQFRDTQGRNRADAAQWSQRLFSCRTAESSLRFRFTGRRACPPRWCHPASGHLMGKREVKTLTRNPTCAFKGPPGSDRGPSSSP